MAGRILMNEYKALSKEKWVNIEVRDGSTEMMWNTVLIVHSSIRKTS